MRSRLSALVTALLCSCLSLALACGEDDGEGSVSLYVTDAPTELYGQILLWIDEVALIGAGEPVTLFQGLRIVDLKQLEAVTDLLHVATDVPAGEYTALRVGVRNIRLVSHPDEQGDTWSIDVDPPPNGSIEVVARTPFDVRRGGHLVIEIDIDAARSLRALEDGGEGLAFQPVVRVDAGERMPSTKPVRLSGILSERIDERRFLLCPRSTSYYADPAHPRCAVVETDAETGVFGISGEPVHLDDLYWGDDSGCAVPDGEGIPIDSNGAISDQEGTVYVDYDGTVGCLDPGAIRGAVRPSFFREMAELEEESDGTEIVVVVGPRDDLTPPDLPIPVPAGLVTVVGVASGRTRVDDEGRIRPVLRALVIEDGGPYVWRTYSGLLYEGEEDMPSPPIRFEPDDWHANASPLEAILHDVTRIVDAAGDEVDLEGEAWHVLADLQQRAHPDLDEPAYWMALVVLERIDDPLDPFPDPQPRWLSGEVVDVDLARSAILFDEAELHESSWYTVGEEALVQFAHSSAAAALSRPGTLDELEGGMKADVLIEADGPPPVFAPVVTAIVSFTEPSPRLD